LAPPGETLIGAGDHLIVIALDDDTTRLSARAPIPDRSVRAAPGRKAPAPEHTLILGWNPRGPIIARELERMVAPGSSLTVLVRE
ncbi:hypothetical protein OFC13_29740, partial [Escherichia coli]|nr:hypothetical protein [Escherichia coli]